MNSVRLFHKAKLAFNSFHPRLYVALPHLCRQNVGTLRNKSELRVLRNSLKCISYCNSMQTESDFQTGNSDGEKAQKVVEDKEFQSILQDFAKDFGIDDEENKLLEDIRKNIDGSPAGKNVSSEDHVVSSEISEKVVDTRLPTKFKDFSERDATIIYSYEEEPHVLEEDDAVYHIDQEFKPKTPYIDLKRGISGVFDLDELVDVLRNESLVDITAISIPRELHYADFLVLVTAKSIRHSSAVTELILKLYKQKKNKKDPFFKVEGDGNANWKALDMGNIVLHIFLEDTRALYDIESLWLLDSKFDSGGNLKVDPMMKIIEEQMEFFNSLQQSTDSRKDS